MSIFVKLAGNELMTIQIVFVRGLITLIITFFILRYKRVTTFGHNRAVLMIRGLVGTVALFLVYESLQRLSLPEATVIQYLYPICTALFASLIISEHIGKILYLAIVVGLAGVYVILDFPFLGSVIIPRLDAMIALSGAFLTGLSYVMVKKASQLRESPYVIMFYFPLVTVPISLLFLPGNWIVPSTSAWFYLILVGISSQLGQLFLTYGYEILPASRAAMTSYLQVPFSVIAGIIIFNDVITINFMIGTIMILSTIILIIKNDDVTVHGNP
jgi:drug/metabolite transporter (DMT)-like permease|tara:strand:+ start:128 stop:943 length:816 start_codon:yes stop_codon:yes gene_type:complete